MILIIIIIVEYLYMCRHASLRFADDNGQQVPGDVSAIPRLDMRFVYIIVAVVFS